VLKFAVLLEMI